MSRYVDLSLHPHTSLRPVFEVVCLTVMLGEVVRNGAVDVDAGRCGICNAVRDSLKGSRRGGTDEQSAGGENKVREMLVPAGSAADAVGSRDVFCDGMVRFASNDALDGLGII